MFEDGRNRPPADHEVGTFDTDGGELLLDDELFGGTGSATVGRRPVRREQTRLGESDTALGFGCSGDLLDLRTDPYALLLAIGQVDTEVTARASRTRVVSRDRHAVEPPSTWRVATARRR